MLKIRVKWNERVTVGLRKGAAFLLAPSAGDDRETHISAPISYLTLPRLQALPPQPAPAHLQGPPQSALPPGSPPLSPLAGQGPLCVPGPCVLPATLCSRHSALVCLPLQEPRGQGPAGRPRDQAGADTQPYAKRPPAGQDGNQAAGTGLHGARPLRGHQPSQPCHPICLKAHVGPRAVVGG